MFKTFGRLPFAPGLKTRPASCQRSESSPVCCPLLLLVSGSLQSCHTRPGPRVPGALPPEGLCSGWVLTPSSLWSRSHVTSPGRPFLTTCLPLWVLISALPVLPSALFFFITVSHTLNVITICHTISYLICCVYFLLLPPDCKPLEGQQAFCVFRMVPSILLETRKVIF